MRRVDSPAYADQDWQSLAKDYGSLPEEGKEEPTREEPTREEPAAGQDTN